MSLLAQQFVQRCLQARWRPEALTAARQLTARPDFAWEEVAAVARREGVAQLLYLVARDADLLPAALSDTLRALYFRAARENVLTFRELSLLLTRLNEAAVPVIVLKGAALTEAVYQNRAVRPMVDIDLLLRQAHAQTAIQELTALGYVVAAIETHPGETLAFENEIMLYKSGEPTMAVELHWGLFDSPFYQQTLSLDWFWRTARPLTIDGAPAQMLGPEALVLHLCGHLLLHHGRGDQLRGIWLHDIAEVVVQFDGASWELLAAKARAYQLTLAVRQALTAVNERYPTLIPANIMAELSRLTPSPQEAQVFDWLTAAQRPVAQRFWADLATLPGWRSRLRYGWHSLFPSPAYMRQRYNKPNAAWLPLLYPYRWLRGLWEWAQTVRN
jgi:hypothetical protein